MANELTIVIKGDAAQFSRTIKQVEAGIARAQGATRSFGHSTVSNTQAASAAIRLMEGDVTNLVRAAERFVGQSEVLSGVLKSAFPVIGAIAIAGVIARGVEQVTKFIEKVNKMPEAIRRGFGAMTLETVTATDELSKTNHELENSIALMERKPVNNTAIEIDNARIAADKLAESLQRDQDRIEQLLKENHIPIYFDLFGKAPTGDEEKAVNTQAALDKADADALVIATHKYGPNSPQVQAAKAKIAADNKAAEVSDQAEIDYLAPGPNRAENVTGDQSANIAIRQGDLARRLAKDDYQAALQQNAQDEAKQKALENAKKAADAAKEAQEKIIQAWEQGLDRAKALYNFSENDEANYWLKLASTAKTGSLSYQKALDNANKAIAEQMKTGAAERDKYLAATTSPYSTYTGSDRQEHTGTAEFGDGKTDLSKDSDVNRGISEQSKAITEWLRNLNEGPAIQKANANAMAEASLQIAVATGQLSRHDAAIAQARLHTLEYNEALEDLEKQLVALPNEGLTPDEQKAKATSIQNQIAILNGQRSIQEANDAQLQRSTSALGELHDSVLHLADDFTDFGRQLSDLVTNTLQNFNQSLSQALMAHAYNGREYRRGITNALGNTARGAGSEILNDVFEQVEGKAVKALIGKNPNAKKPKGTPDDPIYTRDAGAKSQQGGGLLGGLLGKLMGKFGFGGGSILDLGSGGMGSLGAGSLPSIFGDGGPPGMDLSGMGDTGTSIPGFAGGGDFLADRPMIVGERGPELVSFGRSGHITPNHQLFGGDTHLNIDARHSTDPAATAAAVHRVLQPYLPHIAAMAATANNERNARRPPSARR